MKLKLIALIACFCSLIYKGFTQSSFSCEASVIPSDWSILGPLSDEEYSNIGRVISLWISPHDPDYMLAGTRSSGIWKTVDGGENWSNLTAYQLPAAGAASIAVHDNGTPAVSSDDIIYASTEFYGSEIAVYGVGLIFSLDGGATWSRDYSMELDPDLIANPYTQTGLVGNQRISFKPGTYELYVANNQTFLLKMFYFLIGGFVKT